MINPDDITTVRVGQLPTDNIALSDKIPFEKGSLLKQNTVEHLANFIATFIDASDGASFLPESVSNGQTLPETTTNEWMLVGSGTFINVGGGDDIECIELLNVLISNGTTWSLGVAIPINVDASFVSQTIIQGVLTTSPSENAVFEALLLKPNHYIHDFTSLLDQQEFVIPSNYTLGSVFLNRTFLIQSEYTFTGGILTILETLETGTIISTR